MAFIDLEFDRAYFLQLIQASLVVGPTVPFPTLAPIGEAPATDDRLIRRLDWLDTPVWDQAGVPGYQPAAGVLVLRAAVHVDHVSVAELRADPNAAGASVTGSVWLSMTVTPGLLTTAVVAFAADGAPPSVLPRPLVVSRFFLPPLPVPALIAGMVIDDTVVALRFGTVATDDLAAPPAHVLDARASESSANWILHVPAQVFENLVLDPLDAAITGMSDTSVEDAPSASWSDFGNGTWGVTASAGVVRNDACPGIGGSVDISITLSASLAMTLVTLPDPTGGTALDLRITQSVDTSDWDSFRCWLGSGGALGAVLGLINPVLGVGAALGTLAGISEAIRGEVADGFSKVGAPAVPGVAFQQTASDSESATYAGRLNLPTVSLPGDIFQTWDLGIHGLDLYGQSIVLIPTRTVSFAPDGGTLSTGDWTRRINCSHRTIDQSFRYQPILVQDVRLVGTSVVASARIVRWLTSIAEPMGQGAFEEFAPGFFRLRATSLNSGPGWALLHTSAGLRVYRLDPVPDSPAPGPDSRHLIDVFCDAQREFDLVTDLERLRWPEPPPDYDLGFDPLRQWQIVLQNLTPDATVAVLDARTGEELASRDDFAGAGAAAVATLVTDARTELTVRVDGADAAGIRTARRWLVPVQRVEDRDRDAPLLAHDQLVVVPHGGAVIVAVPGQMTS